MLNSLTNLKWCAFFCIISYLSGSRRLVFKVRLRNKGFEPASFASQENNPKNRRYLDSRIPFSCRRWVIFCLVCQALEFRGPLPHRKILKRSVTCFPLIAILMKKGLDNFCLLERKNLAIWHKLWTYEWKQMQATPNSDLLHTSSTFLTMHDRIQDSLNKSISLTK